MFSGCKSKDFKSNALPYLKASPIFRKLQPLKNALSEGTSIIH